MFLAVTPIEDFWDKTDDLLFIGPWCALYGRRAVWSGLRHRFLPDPWRDAARFDAALAYCRNSSSHIFHELTAYLNRVHGTTHEKRYWRLLLDPWLKIHLEQMYDHFTHVEDAFKFEPEARTILLDPECYETPRDMADFVRLMIGDRFHLQLFSQILAKRQSNFPTLRVQPLGMNDPAARPLPGSVSDTAIRRGFKPLLKRGLARVFRMIAATGIARLFVCEVNLSRNELLRIIVGTGFRALPYYGELPDSATPPPIMDDRRRGLAGLQARDEFERVFVSALPNNLPTIFLEGYEHARRATLAAIPHPPQVMFSSLGWHYLDWFKFAAAECAARGTRLWGIQHGGSYGMAGSSSIESFERDVCDRYFTWGWAKTDGDPRLRDLPAPMLSRIAPVSPGDDILFVSTSLDLHNIRLTRDTNGAGAADAIERQARFLRALPGPARGHALVRLFRHDWGWSHRERLLELFPETKFDDSSVPFGRRMREARLVVVDTPSTPMLETLAEDVPCLMTWRADAWTIRPSARPYFDAFREVGVLFESPEEAAAQAARVYKDPRAWWNEPARRAARLKFTRTFALSDPDWISAWLREIRAGLREPS